MNLISLEELKKKGAIYVEELQVGKSSYPFHILEGDKEQYTQFFNCLIQENGQETAFGDFYFARVEEHGKQVLYENSTVGEVRVLQELFADAHRKQGAEEFILVELEQRIMNTLLSISYGELLFSSFHFLCLGCTIWSNYNGRFLVFVKDEECSKRIQSYAIQCGLQYE